MINGAHGFHQVEGRERESARFAECFRREDYSQYISLQRAGDTTVDVWVLGLGAVLRNGEAPRVGEASPGLNSRLAA